MKTRLWFHHIVQEEIIITQHVIDLCPVISQSYPSQIQEVSSHYSCGTQSQKVVVWAAMQSLIPCPLIIVELPLITLEPL
jgi:hypothetical protein